MSLSAAEEQSALESVPECEPLGKVRDVKMTGFES